MRIVIALFLIAAIILVSCASQVQVPQTSDLNSEALSVNIPVTVLDDQTMGTAVNDTEEPDFGSVI